jgi:2-iminobutanoate/2-iminopropanoate deaminase
MKTQIVSDGVHSPNGLFSHAIAVGSGRMLFSSGFLARDAVSGAVGPAGDVAEQTRRCLSNIERVLISAGGTGRDIVKMTVYLSARENYQKMNAIRREMLSGIDYASTTIVSGLIDPEALVEIDIVAVLSETAGAVSG